MNKTHFEVVEEADIRLVDALVSRDKNQLQSLLHPEAVYTNPNGEVFIGSKNLPVNNPKVYQLNDIQIIERHISFFNNVAVVNTIEKRKGMFMEIPFKDLYSTTRTWKFNRGWQMIAATSVLI